jgi:tetratricopeptide (TPR) repeat protein
MADHSRLDDLRRRVQNDPASIAFAQLGEECRRAGEYREAVDVCRAGLAIHPGYLSARVTLGRALIELDELDQAQAELSTVLDGAPENLAAVRGLAHLHRRRGDLERALAHYRDALRLAPADPDLERTVAELTRQVESRAPQAPALEPAAPAQAESRISAAPGIAAEPSFRLDEPSPDTAAAASGTLSQPADDPRTRTLAALEQWLAAVHVTRAARRP